MTFAKSRAKGMRAREWQGIYQHARLLAIHLRLRCLLQQQMKSACRLRVLTWIPGETTTRILVDSIRCRQAGSPIPDDDVIEAVGQEIRKKERMDVRGTMPTTSQFSHTLQLVSTYTYAYIPTYVHRFITAHLLN